jgi:predicted amidohydrolase
MRLALAQYALSSDVRKNVDKVIDMMHEASRRGAEMVTFPELCLSPFFPQFAGNDASDYALAVEAPCIHRLRATCRELRLAASPNVYLQEGPRYFDASLMIGADGGIHGIAKMVHIAQLPGFYEQDYYAPSDTGFKTFDTSLGRLGVVVCFDRHFPESIRTCAVRGAELIVIPTANTQDEPRDLFECELRAAAMQNGVYITMCNRVGKEGSTIFCGESTVVDPNGNIIYKASDVETLTVVDIDLSQVALSQRRRPYLSLRRPELYE